MSRVPQSARRRLGKLNEPHKCQVLLSASVSDFAVRLMRPPKASQRDLRARQHFAL